MVCIDSTSNSLHPANKPGGSTKNSNGQDRDHIFQNSLTIQQTTVVMERVKQNRKSHKEKLTAAVLYRLLSRAKGVVQTYNGE